MLITDIDTINKRFANQLQLWLAFITVQYNDEKLKKNSTKITAKAVMQDPRAIAQNKFEKYKKNTEKANENKRNRNTCKFKLFQP